MAVDSSDMKDVISALRVGNEQNIRAALSNHFDLREGDNKIIF